jgi:pantoate--beta-alanine ligase
MILFKKSADMQDWLDTQKSNGKKIGFVPTMGALHEGHIHLISNCRSCSDLCVCSIFVNPAQFNDPKDYEKYPLSIEKDIEMLSRAGTDVLFLPSVQEIYPNGQKKLETYDLGPLETILEGRYRPGHFQGVCQVMSRLLAIVKPDDLFMGQKDYQQFHSVPTVREEDGLAQSSRNRRLTPGQRQNAVAISQALKAMKGKVAEGNAKEILNVARETLDAAQFITDYIAIARASDLQPLENWNGKDKVIALIAASQGDVRLIDNMMLN